MTLDSFLQLRFSRALGFDEFIDLRPTSPSRIHELLKLWTIVRQVAAGLDFIHTLGEMHRDIKPENSSSAIV